MSFSVTSSAVDAMILSSTEWTVLLIVSSVIALGTFVVYRFFNEDVDKTKKSVMIKIDRSGKHRYEIKEDVDNRMTFWMKVIVFIITFSLLFIPIRSWFYNS